MENINTTGTTPPPPKKWSTGKIVLIIIVVLLLFLIVHRVYVRMQGRLGVRGGSPSNVQNSSVPAAYQDLYSSLQNELDGFETEIAKLPAPASTKPIIFGSDLTSANDNIGVGLLKADAMDTVKKQLDSMQKLGISGVHVTIQWPLFSKTYDPDYEKYLAFYKNVAQELKKRNIKFFAHNTINFGPPFSGYNHAIPKISFADYQKEKRIMAENIINELHPDYLILSSEPATEAHNSGLTELGDPTKTKQLTEYVMNGNGADVGPLNKGTTLVGAGAGSWDSIDFDRNYVAIPSLDFISLHIYPIDPKNVKGAIAAAQLVMSSGKVLVTDEVGLYKIGGHEKYQGAVAAAPEIYKRDVFSFFEPLDERFLKDVTNFAKATNSEFVSYFWYRNLAAYIEYQPGDENKSYTDLQKLENQASWANIIAGKFSPLGNFYQNLISGNK